MVAAAFAKPEAANQRFFVYGPEAFTIEEAMRTYCRIAAPDKQVRVTPFWMMSAIDRLFMGGRLKPTIEIMKLNARLGEVGDDTATKHILGAPTTTLQNWCQQSASQQSA
ncbi:MAG: hypothetical protein K8I60_08295 [Anaerolineae bacterium]|nr:hypothetical protein [Anaerolineae bacterium]